MRKHISKLKDNDYIWLYGSIIWDNCTTYEKEF